MIEALMLNHGTLISTERFMERYGAMTLMLR